MPQHFCHPGWVSCTLKPFDYRSHADTASTATRHLRVHAAVALNPEPYTRVHAAITMATCASEARSSSPEGTGLCLLPVRAGSAAMAGGAIYIPGQSKLQVHGCMFEGNRAGLNGGAICIEHPPDLFEDPSNGAGEAPWPQVSIFVQG